MNDEQIDPEVIKGLLPDVPGRSGIVHERARGLIKLILGNEGSPEDQTRAINYIRLAVWFSDESQRRAAPDLMDSVRARLADGNAADEAEA